jgi:hypothetical protein
MDCGSTFVDIRQRRIVRAGFDTETHALDGFAFLRPTIVSLGLCVFDAATGEVLETFYAELKAHGDFAASGWPETSPFHDVIGSRAEALGLPVADALGRVLEIVRSHGVQSIVAHNASFDMLAIGTVRSHEAAAAAARDALLAMPWTCTLALSREVAPEERCHRLSVVHGRVANAGGPAKKWHNALDDAVACVEVYCGLIRSWRRPVRCSLAVVGEGVALTLSTPNSKPQTAKKLRS